MCGPLIHFSLRRRYRTRARWKGRHFVNCYLCCPLEKWPPLSSLRRNSLGQIYPCRSCTVCQQAHPLCISYFQHASEGTVTHDTASLGAGLCARWQGQLWLPDKSVVWCCPHSNRIRGTEASRILPVLFDTNDSSSCFAVPCVKPVWLFQSLVKAVDRGEGSWGLLFIHSVHHYWINNSSCDGNSSGHILRAYVSNTVLSLCVFSHRAIRLPWGVGMMTLCGNTEIKVKVVLL